MNKGSIAQIIKDFDFSRVDMRRLAESFRSEMDRGLSGMASSLKMIPTYVGQPTGEETGEFIALDLGGTNFRILSLELKGRGRIGKPAIMSFKLGAKEISGDGEDLRRATRSLLPVFRRHDKAQLAGDVAPGHKLEWLDDFWRLDRFQPGYWPASRHDRHECGLYPGRILP